jgi:hypothetical protein
MLEEIKAQMATVSSREKRLDIIYDVIDDALIAGKFNEINQMFTEIKCGEFEATELLGFLTITLMAHSKLPNRAWFYDQCKIHLLKDHPLTEVKQMLDGLRFPHQAQTKSKQIITK